MAAPPERISLKRRRSHEAVDLLRFDHEKPGKRRHTGFIFRRLETEHIPPDRRQPWQRSAPDGGMVDSIPAAEPGHMTTSVTKPHVVSHQQPRRFHLVSDLTKGLPNIDSSGSLHRGRAKHYRNLRPPLATFVEQLPRIQAVASPREIGDKSAQVMKQQTHHTVASDEPYAYHERNVPPTNHPAATPTEQPQPPAKTGHSMYDHPDTWDLESDQLATELAAFAMELEPEAAHDTGNRVAHDPDVKPVAPSEPMVLDDDLVYDTYIRVTYEDMDLDPVAIDPEVNFGILVVDEDVEDLWQEYLNEDADDEDEWDAEDSNAEDNPANDYPDEEVDSDDEFGRNLYRYRNDTSDDELYNEYYDD
ncbi:hypothetical protein DV736_g575, partial [Chaetothyriales sp. CBS 134916]